MLLGLLAGCGQEQQTPEQQIRQRIDALVEAVEARESLALNDFLHPDYADSRHPDRRTALRTLLGYLLRHRGIHLFTLVRSIDYVEDAQAAHVTVLVAMTGVPVESLETLVSLKADLYRFDVQLLNDDDWQVRSAEWQRADPRSLIGVN